MHWFLEMRFLIWDKHDKMRAIIIQLAFMIYELSTYFFANTFDFVVLYNVYIRSFNESSPLSSLRC